MCGDLLLAEAWQRTKRTDSIAAISRNEWLEAVGALVEE
ncbi:PaRep2b protein [Pyrobaculum aerophilum]|nr:PaRep2b protein [Pyrobaculum aerophilum]